MSLSKQLEDQFKGKRFWNHLSTKRDPAKRRTYTLESIGMDPDTGAPVMNYRSDKTKNLYSMDANRFFGMIKNGKTWVPRFVLAGLDYQNRTEAQVNQQQSDEDEVE